MGNSGPRRDRRSNRRVEGSGTTGRLGTSVAARILDLSLSGVRLETSAALAPGGRYPLQVDGGTARPLGVEVVWCRLERAGIPGRGALFRAGARLIGDDLPGPRIRS